LINALQRSEIGGLEFSECGVGLRFNHPRLNHVTSRSMWPQRIARRAATFLAADRDSSLHRWHSVTAADRPCEAPASAAAFEDYRFSSPAWALPSACRWGSSEASCAVLPMLRRRRCDARARGEIAQYQRADVVDREIDTAQRIGQLLHVAMPPRWRDQAN